jgi:hypothetical protein
MEFVDNERGGKMLCLNGYMYTKKAQNFSPARPLQEPKSTFCQFRLEENRLCRRNGTR